MGEDYALWGLRGKQSIVSAMREMRCVQQGLRGEAGSIDRVPHGRFRVV
jgi:hypothetical protein